MYRDPKPDGVDITVAGELRSTKCTNVVMFHVPIIGAAVFFECSIYIHERAQSGVLQCTNNEMVQFTIIIIDVQ